MERYSLLWGTDKVGAYKSLGVSKGLGTFMNKVGATESEHTAQTVQEILRSFKKLPDYNDAGQAKPVAIRYAPMHLYRLPTMPDSIQPFYAMSITGPENREGRNTVFSKTVFFARELMLKQDEFNYLDQIFGTKVLFSSDIDAYREGKEVYCSDEIPQHVVPKMKQADLPYAVRTVEAIYQDKNVIFRLEKGLDVPFLDRAKELLMQIYSLMQPRLAAETGFAVYQDPDEIANLCRTTNIRIFVLPAEASLTGLESGENIIFDLADPATNAGVQKNPLTETLLAWATSTLPWKRKVSCMEQWFAGAEGTFQEAEPFVQGTEAGFAAIEKWKQDRQQIAAAKSLQELKSFYETYVVNSIVPWAEEDFRTAVEAAHKANLSNWLADAGADMVIALDQGDNETAKAHMVLYKFANNYGTVAAKDVADTLSKKVDAYAKTRDEKQWRAHFEPIIANLEAKLDATMADLSETRTNLSTEKSNHAATTAQLEEAKQQREDALYAAKRATDALQPTKDELADTREELSKAKGTISKLKEKMEMMDEQLRRAGARKPKSPLFIMLPAWIALAAIVLSLVLCSLCWWLIPKIGNKQETETEVVETPVTVVPEVTPEVQPPVEETPEPEVVTPEKGWHGEETVQWIQSEVPEIKTIVTTDIQGHEEMPAGTTVLALLTTEAEWSVEETQPETDVVPAADTDAAPAADAETADVSAETDANAQTEENQEPVTDSTEEEAAAVRNHALLLKGKVAAEDFAELTDANLLVVTEELSLLVYGDDTMTNAAVKALQLIAPEAAAEEPAVPETTATPETTVATDAPVTAEATVENESAVTPAQEDVPVANDAEEETEKEPAEQIFICVGGQWLDVTGLEEDAAWWRGISSWSTSEAALADAQSKLNTNSVPVLEIATAQRTVAVYDYEDDTAKAGSLEEKMKEDHPFVLRQDAVVVIGW